MGADTNSYGGLTGVAQGAAVRMNITQPTVVKTGKGRAVRLVIIVPGSGDGALYDQATITGTDPTQQFGVISSGKSAGDGYILDWPFAVGFLVVPGAGQTVAVSYQ